MRGEKETREKRIQRLRERKHESAKIGMPSERQHESAKMKKGKKSRTK
jgi:hypothetical protein